MKVKRHLLFILMALLSLASNAADNKGKCGENLTWTYDDATKTLTISGTGAMADYDTSEKHMNPWHTYRTRMSVVVIEEGVTSIGRYAFYDCVYLDSVKVSNSVTSIGEYAFLQTGLSKIDLSANLKSIARHAFEHTALSSIEIPNSVTEIGDSVFFACSGLKSVTYGSGMSYIGRSFFENCSNLTSVKIPNSIDTIKEYAFRGCVRLASIDIPNSVTSIAAKAFYGSGLNKLVIPKGVTSIGEDAFGFCSNLASITVSSENDKYESRDDCNAIIEERSKTLIVGCKNTVIPNDVTKIGFAAFLGSKGLTSIVIPEGVQEIGSSSFRETGLTSIRIPQSVAAIGDFTFYNCKDLTSVVAKKEEPVELSDSVFGRISDGCVLTVPSSTKTAYITKGWTEEVFKGAVVEMDGKDAKSIKFDDATVKAVCVTQWDTNEDGELSEQEASVVKVLGTVFKRNAYIRNFKELKYFTALDSIGDALEGCSGLRKIEIPKKVTSIKSDVFSGCTSLDSIYVAGGNKIYDSRDSCNAVIRKSDNKLIVGCKYTRIPDDVTAIGDSAFYNCSGLKRIEIPESVKEIGMRAFSYCSGLDSIFVADGNAKYESPESCNAIIQIENGDSTLIVGCKNTKIPNGITVIGGFAFEGCRGLTAIDIPMSVMSIDTCAFVGCTGIRALVIPETVKKISGLAFKGCSNLGSVVSMNKEPFELQKGVFEGISGACVLTVATGTKEDYVNKGWSESVFRGGVVEVDAIPQNIEFADKKVKEICVALWDTNNDKELSQDEAAVVKDLGTVFSGNNEITSFDELKYFTTLTNIRNFAFAECAKLKSIVVPDSVKVIGEKAFSNCPSLEAIVVASGNKAYDSRYDSKAIIRTKDSALIVGCKNTLIPNTVSSIEEAAFMGSKGLTSIEIPNSVTSIKNSAFSGCTALKTVLFGKYLTKIGNDAFKSCTSLMDFVLPNGVTSIGQSAFSGCTSITSITIPANVTEIGQQILEGCSSLDSIFVASENTIFDSRDSCNAIIRTNDSTLIVGCKNSEIPAGVKTVGHRAFNGCTGLTSIKMPKGVTTIKNSAFMGCKGLADLTIGDDVTIIGDSAFNNCERLNIVSIPACVTTIGGNAFGNCRNLTTVDIPNSVTSIGSGAFSGCSELSSVVSLIEQPYVFGKNAFDGISKGCVLTVPSGTINDYLTKGWTKEVFKGGVVEAEDENTEYIGFADEKVKAICLAQWDTNRDGKLSDKEAGVVQVLGAAFKGNKEITSFKELNYFKGITSLDDAFSGCSKLEAIEIPEGIEKIGRKTFLGCDSLKSIVVVSENKIYDSRDSCNAIIRKKDNTLVAGCKTTCIPDDVAAIGDSAFYNCSGLDTLEIPKSVSAIGNSTFYKCSGLTSIEFPDNLAEIGDSAFCYCPGLNIIRIPKGVTSIGSKAFSRCYGLDSIFVAIENQTFDSRDSCNAIIRKKDNTLILGCRNTQIKNGVAAIGDRAFEGCTGLSSIKIPASVTSIGTGAFNGCTGLALFTIPSDVKTIGGSAFQNCTGLSEIIIQANITSIEGSTFANCHSLTTIEIPTSVTSIGSSAFLGCTSMASIVIPENVSEIGNNAFKGCSRLSYVVVKAEEPYSFGNNAFDGISDNCLLVVPAGTRDKYKAKGWTDEVFKGGVFGEDEMLYDPDILKFADPAVKAICIRKWDTNGDGELSLKEASSVASLGLVFQNNDKITSFKELKYFTGLTQIGNNAFENCSGLTSIEIPDSITSIGRNVFKGCTSLTYVGLHGKVKSIGQYAFDGCKSLKFIDIPNSVSSIENGTFSGCESLTYVVLPNSITKLGKYSFSGCKKLIDVYCYATEVPTAGLDAFSNFATATLHVPADSIEAYRKAEPWKRFSKIVPIEPIYTLLYMIDDDVYMSYKVEEGAAIIPLGMPSKKGYTFEWKELPEVMPAHDVTVYGSYTINKYKLIYMVNDEVYQTYEVEYGTQLTPIDGPSEESYLFSGWSEIPETMPAHDVEITGTLTRHFVLAHVVKVVNFIMNSNATSDDIALYDVNGDSELDIGDVILIVKNVLDNGGSMESREAMRRAPGFVDFSQCTAAQFDLVVDKNTTIKSIRLVGSMTRTHQLMCKRIDENTYSVVVFSLSNQLLNPENGSIVTVETDGGDVNVQNMMVVTPSGETYYYQDDDIITSIHQLNNSEKPKECYDLKGYRVNESDLRKGSIVIYGKKVFVK